MSTTLDQLALYKAVDDRRRDLSMHWQDVAQQIGVSQNTMSAFKTRSASPRLNTLLQLMSFLEQTDLGPYMREVPSSTGR